MTLICIDCINVERAIKVLEICKSKMRFSYIKLLSSIENDSPHWVKIQPLTSLVMYSVFMLKDIYKYIDTKHFLIVQRDGFILNGESFKEEWLELDYIGPLFIQYDKVGSGGFSLRSKKIMQDISKTLPEWDGTEAGANEIQKGLGYYEDGVIALSQFGKKYKIGTPKQAADFSQGGNRNPEYFRERPFGFHRTWQTIDFKTGIVDSSDLSKDLQSNYDFEEI